MQFEELKENVSLLFPQQPKEDDDHYIFFMREALDPFKNKPGDLTPIWDKIKLYDGTKNRPTLGFFIAIASGSVLSSAGEFAYYVCPQCSTKLSESSDGGCPVCHTAKGEKHYRHSPIQVLGVKPSCFDCTAYSEFAMGPTCEDYGTPRFETCNYRSECKCMTCCRFEYQRHYHPKKLQDNYEEALKYLPKPLSGNSVAFFDDRASFVDINSMLKEVYKKK